VYKLQRKIKQTITLVTLSFAFTFFTSCEKVEQQPSLNIRVVNLSQQSIDDLLVYSLTGVSSFGTVDAGGNTSYQPVGEAYSSPACRFVVNGSSYQVMIRCANPAPAKITEGNYSLVINKNSGNEFDVILHRD
jgi:hypothetical protein